MAELQKDKIYWIMKFVVIIICLGIIVSGFTLLVSFITAPLHLQRFIINIYVFAFAIKIILCELNWGYFLRLFPYMGNSFGKGAFFVFVGFLKLTFGESLSTMIGLVLLICGVGFMVMYFIRDKGEAQTNGTPVK